MHSVEIGKTVRLKSDMGEKLKRHAFVPIILAAFMLPALPSECRAEQNMPAAEQQTEADKRRKAVARINDVVLTNADLEEVLGRLVPATAYHRTMTPEKRESFRPRAMEQLIEEELLFQGARKKGLKVEKGKVKEAREATIKRLGGGKQFKAALEAAGLTEKQYEGRLERKFLIEDILRVEVEDKAEVSDAEVGEFYERNKQTFLRPESRRVRHILIKVDPTATDEERQRLRERAEEVLEKAQKGEDFAQLAWDYSDDQYRVKGGDYGIVHRGRFEKSVEDVIFGSEAGALSGVIESIFGYHIVRVEEVLEAEQMKLEDVAQKIKKDLTKKRREALKAALLDGLRAGAKIEVYQ
jgi:parvulin-like peptidyl-prolyl isomerase